MINLNIKELTNKANKIEFVKFTSQNKGIEYKNITNKKLKVFVKVFAENRIMVSDGHWCEFKHCVLLRFHQSTRTLMLPVLT